MRTFEQSSFVSPLFFTAISAIFYHLFSLSFFHSFFFFFLHSSAAVSSSLEDNKSN